MNPNYSIETSLPAYEKGSEKRIIQESKVLSQIKRLGNNACIKSLAQALGIPDATISARVNDLIDKGKVRYNGKFKYEDYTRKKIEIIETEELETNNTLTLFQ